MDKTSFAMSNKENIKFTFQKNDIEILPYIPQAVKMQILKDYVTTLTGEGAIFDNYYGAEWSVILRIMEHCSNVEINGDNFESLMSSGLWDEVSKKIENYQELREDINLVVKYYFEQKNVENSVGSVVGGLAKTLQGFLDKISSLDLSKEGVAELVASLNKEVNQFDEKFPANGIVKKPRKKKVKDVAPTNGE